MTAVLTKYFETSLGRYFFDYPKRHAGRIHERFVAGGDLFFSDLAAKHPAHGSRRPDDRELVEMIQLDPCLEAVLLYRVERSLFLDDPDDPLLPYLAGLMRLKTGIELYYSTEIGPGLNVMHGMGVVVGPRYKIGRNFTINHGATIGQSGADEPESIIIGDNVRIFAGAKVIGRVRIGDNVHIGANAVLIDDAESNSVYLGVPARKVRDLYHDFEVVPPPLSAPL